MAHKTLIGSTAYEITGGRDLIGGTGYDKKSGKVLVGGTAYDIPFSNGIPLSTITPGAILYLNESGSPVPFYVAKHDYESALNGAGRTLLVRKDVCDEVQISVNDFAGNALCSWLNDTYAKRLDADIQSAIGTTTFYYTSSRGGKFSKTTLQKAVFQLSLTELGKSASNANTEGSALPIASTLQIAYRNGSTSSQWTRTPRTDQEFNPFVYYVNYEGNAIANYAVYYMGSLPSRPTFTLPATTAVIANADGTYTLAA